MTTLVSDETLGQVVRLVWERPILLADRTAIMTHVLEDQWAAALDVARELLSPEDDAIAAIDRANEEAAEEYTKRETEEHAATCGPLEVDPLIVSPEVARDLMRVERDEARRERDEARAELAATKKKLQGVMYGRRKR